MHDGNPMGDSNAFWGVGADQRLGNTMNASERFDLVGRHFGSTGTATAVPDPAGVTLVMPRHLREVRIEIGPDASDHDGQTGIEIVRREHIDPITDSAFVNPENHVLESCFTRQLPATDGDGVVLTHFLRVRSPKSSSLGCRNCQTTGTVKATVRPMVTQIAVV